MAELRKRFKVIYAERLAHMMLFGSQARGDSEAGSDIDVLVVFRGTVNPGREIARTGETTAALSLNHDAVISCTFISEERYDTERSPLLLNVRREGVAT